MKKWIFLSIAIVSVACLGVIGYQYALTAASTKVIEKVQEELLTEDAVDQLMNDPQVQKFVAGIEIDEEMKEDLPFQTKEEGLKIVMGKFSAGELKEIAMKARGGITVDEKVELYDKYKDRFSEEELKALLVIGLSEMN
ncbi:hypothetical protein GN156_15965 [bacterium LRH843]|nr:hypothetical protein [bacterium LRH843]